MKLMAHKAASRGMAAGGAEGGRLRRSPCPDIAKRRRTQKEYCARRVRMSSDASGSSCGSRVILGLQEVARREPSTLEGKI